MDDVGLLLAELPNLRPSCITLVGPWDGEESPLIGLVGGGGPKGPGGLMFWYQDQ